MLTCPVFPPRSKGDNYTPLCCFIYFPLDYHLMEDQEHVVSRRPRSDVLHVLHRDLVEGSDSGGNAIKDQIAISQIFQASLGNLI